MKGNQITNDRWEELIVGRYYLIYRPDYGIYKKFGKKQFSIRKMDKDTLFLIKYGFEKHGKDNNIWIEINNEDEYMSSKNICERYDEWE